MDANFRTSSRALVATAVLAGLATLSTACAWSVPADPGRNAALRGRPLDASASDGDAAGPAPARAIGGAAPDDGARAIYLAKCGQCHAPWSPRHATPDEWPGYVRKYGPRAGLFGEERERVLRWLQANAR